ncbi:hypothetical protein MAPG_02208 [Magnaporthiopsis poae ATCC 64411]|uniref:Ankyrin repeat protein n=1 Tax=Magnaporthiopsis poae (strain ATCC 64411 / 73-15) TaxID=644358 RepID=A0A0C4DQR2_MAGP6|nr:hypothetical protein MAPG_02208 [Magnaporthiopsis poae ATCC 64411]
MNELDSELEEPGPPWLLDIERREQLRPVAEDDDEHLREIFHAARDGDIGRLKAALETLTQSREQVNISMRHDLDYLCETPLNAAARGGHFDVTVLLIALGADLEASAGERGDMFTPLHNAVESGNPAMVRLLLDSGANIQAPWVTEMDGLYGNATVLVVKPDKEPEAMIETMDMLLDRGLDVEGSSLYGDDWLMRDALDTGYAKLVKHLMKRGVSLLKDRRENLCAAAGSFQSSEALEFLVQEQGYHDINDCLAALRALALSRSYWRPQTQLARFEMARLLISHITRDLGPGRALGGMPGIGILLPWALRDGNAALARLLLQHGIGTSEHCFEADGGVDCTIFSSYTYDRTPLLLDACINDSDPEIIKLLLQGGADINCRRGGAPCSDRDLNPLYGTPGDNALHESVLSPVTVKLLLDAGVDPRARNTRGEIPLLTHVRRIDQKFVPYASKPTKDDFVSCIRLLASACQTPDDINAVDKHGRSALHLLPRKLRNDWENLNVIYPHDVETYVETVRILIGRGARLDIRDDRGRTVVDAFQQAGGRPLLEALWKAGAQMPNEGGTWPSIKQ